jgi:PIN domain nuclease of toxin-antitoxin system
VYVSVASVWEMAIKYKAGKHAAAAGLAGDQAQGPFGPQAPIAQAKIESLAILGTDSRFDEYYVGPLW